MIKPLYSIVLDDEEIVIREPIDQCDYRSLMDVQLRIWAMPDYSEAVTYHALIAAHRNGGVVLGAFRKNSCKAVGVVFSFPGYENGMIYLYSHLTGVIPEKRYRGLGYYLKLAQRRLAIEKGYYLVKWTFDPLRSSNAYFNIAKLGVIVRSFYPDYYGELQDELNRGMPSDRLIAEWWIRSKRVRKVVDEGRKATIDLDKVLRLEPHIAVEAVERGGVLVVEEYSLEKGHDLVLVEIPGDIESLRKNYHEELMRWRNTLRKVFHHYLNQQGYIIIGYIVKREKPLKGYYVLWRRSLSEILDGALPWTSS